MSLPINYEQIQRDDIAAAWLRINALEARIAELERKVDALASKRQRTARGHT